MKINKSVYCELDKLNDRQKIEFCIFCAERTIKLYSYFDRMIKEENLEELVENREGYPVLREILDYAKTNIVTDRGDKNKIEGYISSCAKLMPDYDDYGGGYQTIAAQYIPRTIGFIFEFYNRKESRFVYWCSDNNIEILNAISSDQYRSKNVEKNDEDRRAYIVSKYLQEIRIQSQFINMLKESVSLSDLIEFTKNNIITKDCL